jgi:hypothetical protein
MRSPRLRTWLLAGGFLIIATTVQLLRQTGHHVWDTVWAEDGRVYTTDALTHPALATIGRGYAGYIQVLPRLVALGTRVVPADRISTYLAVSAALITSALGLVVIRSTHGWIRSWPIRLCVGAMLVAAPVFYFELNATVANLNWPLLAATFWVVASRRERGGDVALRVLVVALAALSTSVAVVLLPGALVVTAMRRRRADVVVCAAFVAALAVQAVADLSTSPAKPAPGWTVAYVAKAFAARGLGSLAIGERWIPHLWLAHPDLLMVGSTLLVVGVAVVAIVATPTPRRRPSSASGQGGLWSWLLSLEFDRWWMAGTCAALALLAYLATSWIRGATAVGLTLDGHFNLGGSRYLYVPIFLLFSALAVLVDGSRRRWLEAFFVTWTVLVMVSSLHLGTLRSPGPSWSNGVAAARVTCRAHPDQAQVLIPTAPGAGWFVTVPCSDLR